jgi:hypothetical protein
MKKPAALCLLPAILLTLCHPEQLRGSNATEEASKLSRFAGVCRGPPVCAVFACWGENPQAKFRAKSREPFGSRGLLSHQDRLREFDRYFFSNPHFTAPTAATTFIYPPPRPRRASRADRIGTCSRSFLTTALMPSAISVQYLCLLLLPSIALASLGRI